MAELTQAEKKAADDAAKVAEKALADATAKKQVADEAAAEAAKPEFVMAPGKAITTKVGIVGAGEEITPAMLAGGKGAFNAFVKSKHILANK